MDHIPLFSGLNGYNTHSKINRFIGNKEGS
ncbi:MAG: hypothetical protein K0Q87_3458 [Neobacillus sp.]|nr:hypothetical protein [Neobacillus sp.]